MSIKTHYDTLKVTRDAPDEVISAAYKALARIHHPDKAGSDPVSMTIMQNINISYKILSDPQKRSEHDLWIMQQERQSNSGSSGKDGRSAAGGAKSESNEKVDKATAEAAKWSAWSDKVAQEAKEAQVRAEKAVADLAKAKPEDRAKWEVWVTKTERDAKEAKERAEKAAAQSAKATAAAMDAVSKATGGVGDSK